MNDLVIVLGVFSGVGKSTWFQPSMNVSSGDLLAEQIPA
jgi:hypothetical protein